MSSFPTDELIVFKIAIAPPTGMVADGTQAPWAEDPKMEVLYHIRPYFVAIFPYIGQKYMVDTSNKSDPEIPIEYCLSI